MTFFAQSCGTTIGTGLLTWDGHAFGVFPANPPSCKWTFKIVPRDGYKQPGKHRICAGADVYSCATYTILALRPKPTPKPTPKPVAAPTATASPSPSPSLTDVAIPTVTAVALVSATPTPAPATPTAPDASPLPDLMGAGGASLDLTPVFIGGAILLVLLIGVVIAMVRRARVLPPPR